VAGGGRVDITVGSALDIFGGQLPYSEVVAWHRRQQQQQQQQQDEPPASPGGGGGGRGGGSSMLGEPQPDGTILFRDLHLKGQAKVSPDGTVTYTF
jgi:phosphoribosylformimino-5-aminoimidazole carboxamide ribotide isomerase